MIAALFVQTNGCYFGLPNVDPWDKARDARTYSGPWPVVAHPPCERWTRMHGFIEHVYPGRFKRGDDDGCFASALAAVRNFGGVIEHPEGSHAWRHFGIKVPPKSGGWISAGLFVGGWTCSVEQGAYGHPSRKATWLYVSGIEPPELRWGSASGIFPWISFLEYNSEEGRQRAVRTGVCQRQSHRQRAATPIEFRDLLIGMASTARVRHAA